MSEYSGPLPVPTPETRPFWEAARRHELWLQHCRACGAYVFYPRAACPRCLGPDLEWRRVSGRGRLHTFTVVHRGARSFPLPAPYVIAIVELDEGPRMMTNVVDCDVTDVAVGMPVEVTFRAIDDTDTESVTIPVFRPRSGYTTAA